MPIGPTARYLILTVAAGHGHVRAAEALALALRHRGGEVTVVDAVRHTNPVLGRALIGAYLETLRLGPGLWRFLYQRAALDDTCAWAQRGFGRWSSLVAAPKLVSLIAQTRPDALVCTHPFPLGTLSHLRERGLIPPTPCVAVVTDLGFHPFWIWPGTARYALAHQGLRRSFQQWGVARTQLVTTGIPVSPAFLRLPPAAEARKALGLEPRLPVVMVMCGGLGMGPLAEVVRRLDEGAGDCQVLVVTGMNTRLARDLAARGWRQRVAIVGYVPETATLMAAASLLVSKPGGLTAAEALAAGLPMVMVSPLPGQEEANAVQLKRWGVGVCASTPTEAARLARELLADEAALSRMRSRVKAVRRPDAAQVLAGRIEQMVRAGGRRP